MSVGQAWANSMLRRAGDRRWRTHVAHLATVGRKHGGVLLVDTLAEKAADGNVPADLGGLGESGELARTTKGSTGSVTDVWRKRGCGKDEPLPDSSPKGPPALRERGFSCWPWTFPKPPGFGPSCRPHALCIERASVTGDLAGGGAQGRRTVIQHALRRLKRDRDRSYQL